MDRTSKIDELRQALSIEQTVQENNWFNKKTSLKELRKQGVVIHPIHVYKKRFGYADYPIFSFSFSHEINLSLFKGGVPITVFTKDNQELCNGILLFIEGNQGEVTLHTPDFPDWLDTETVGLKLAPDSRSFNLMHGVLKKIQKQEDKNLTQLFDYLHGFKSLPQPSFKEIDVFFNTELNQTQKDAVKYLIAENQLSLLHGPPGTGKTTTLVEVCQQLIKNGKKVMVSAPSNAAIDHFANCLISFEIPIFRFGNTAKVNENVWKYTPEGILQREDYAKSLKKLRVKAAEYRKLARQYKRNFGKSEREQRKLLNNEAKALREEIKKTTTFYLEKSLKEAAVILGTPVGLRDPLLYDTYFDVVIIDEAAQCLEPMAWLCLQMGKNTILAGDPFQLPPTVISNEAAQKGLSVSILEHCFKANLPTQLLAIQYRMPPVIANFSSNYFYNDKLQSYKSNAKEGEQLIFWDTAGANYSEMVEEEGTSISNEEELIFIQQLIPALNTDTVFISPYAGQVRKAKTFFPSIRCSTIDAFQGQEADTIIISLVRSNSEGNIGFLKDYRRMNVAMTRAKERLIIVGDSATLGANPFYKKFLEYLEKTGGYRSVFEYNL